MKPKTDEKIKAEANAFANKNFELCSYHCYDDKRLTDFDKSSDSYFHGYKSAQSNMEAEMIKFAEWIGRNGLRLTRHTEYEWIHPMKGCIATSMKELKEIYKRELNNKEGKQ